MPGDYRALENHTKKCAGTAVPLPLAATPGQPQPRQPARQQSPPLLPRPTHVRGAVDAHRIPGMQVAQLLHQVQGGGALGDHHAAAALGPQDLPQQDAEGGHFAWSQQGSSSGGAAQRRLGMAQRACRPLSERRQQKAQRRQHRQHGDGSRRSGGAPDSMGSKALLLLVLPPAPLPAAAGSAASPSLWQASSSGVNSAGWLQILRRLLSTESACMQPSGQGLQSQRRLFGRDSDSCIWSDRASGNRMHLVIAPVAQPGRQALKIQQQQQQQHVRIISRISQHEDSEHTRYEAPRTGQAGCDDGAVACIGSTNSGWLPCGTPAAGSSPLAQPLTWSPKSDPVVFSSLRTEEPPSTAL